MVRVEKNELLAGLRKVISPKKAMIPILTNYKIQSSDQKNKIEISGTDLEIYTKAYVSGFVQDEINVCVNSKKFYEIAKVLPGEVIDIYVDGSSLKISSGKVKYSIPVMDPSDFPEFSIEGNGNHFTVESKDLLMAIESTVYASSNEEARFLLQGVCFSFTGKELDVVATDGYRLALYKIGNVESNFTGKYIVPKKSVSELRKMLIDKDTVHIYLENNEILFKTDTWALKTRLLNGPFPEYEMVIPKTYTYTITVEKHEFIESIRRVLAGSESKIKKILLSIKENTLKLSHEDQNTQAEDFMQITNTDNAELEIAFNGNYLMEAILQTRSQNVKIYFTGTDSQTVVKSEEENDNYLAIVMPMS